MIAFELLKNRFWLLENNGIRVGTLHKDGSMYVIRTIDGKFRFPTTTEIKQIKFKRRPTIVSLNDAFGYPTSKSPKSIMLRIKNRIPLFKKKINSDCIFCAGYYVIKFNHAWVYSFCPKLETLETHKYLGPFKTKSESKEAFKNERKHSTNNSINSAN